MHDETICASIINMMTEFKNNRYEIRLKPYNQKYMTAKIIPESCDQKSDDQKSYDPYLLQPIAILQFLSRDKTSV